MTRKMFALTYSYVKDILAKRAPYRDAHLKLANEHRAKGLLISGGPLLDGGQPVGALFLFSSPSKDVVDKFVLDDPYVSAHLVPTHSIHEYSVVVGELAAPFSKL